MYWANFLHIYQPPTQEEKIVRKVAAECYRKLVAILKEFPKARITLNINACLTEQLHKYELSDIILDLKNLAERGQIEFTGSAKYHPILSLIPKEEIIRQIKLNEETNRGLLGDIYKPKGFFPPEMCYSRKVAEVAKECGYNWVVIDEIGYNGKLGEVAADRIYYLKGLPDFKVFFKERTYSAGITYGNFTRGIDLLKSLGNRIKEKEYLLTGTDGEVYGHHRPGQERLLIDIFAGNELSTVTISQLIEIFKEEEEVKPLPSSWSTWEDEMAEGVPYPQWRYPQNTIHKLQWKLTDLAIEAINRTLTPSQSYYKARTLLDEGLHSCQYWWASCRPWWSTEMIERGAKRLLESLEALGGSISEGNLATARSLYEQIVETSRYWQESGKAQELKEEYRKGHREVSTELTFGEVKKDSSWEN